MIFSLNRLISALAGRKDYAAAKQSYQRSIKLSGESGQTWLITLTLCELAKMLLMEGELERAAVLFAMSIAHPTITKRNIKIVLPALALETSLPPAIFGAAVERGRRLDLDTVVDELMRE